MRCLHINIRQATFIVITVIVNNVEVSQMTEPESKGSESFTKKSTTDVTLPSDCLSNEKNCNQLNYPCIACPILNSNCEYGNENTTICKAQLGVQCKGDTSFERKYVCRYCYQTESWEHTCELKANCNSVASPRAYYIANCTVHDDILCIGNRTFNKKIRCNWTGGYRWSTALLLSVTLGGFGADRFYLGHWQEGIGKLFSFGGLGVWTIIDVILISLHYLGPADGSLYI